MVSELFTAGSVSGPGLSVEHMFGVALLRNVVADRGCAAGQAHASRNPPGSACSSSRLKGALRARINGVERSRAANIKAVAEGTVTLATRILLFKTQIEHRYPCAPITNHTFKAEVTFCVRGVITAPCPVPLSLTVTTPSSRMPTLSHFWIKRMMRRSPIRCSRKRTSHCWLISSKTIGRRRPVSSSPSCSRSRQRAHPVRRACRARVGIHTEPEEVFLVDRIEHRNSRPLDDLVL